VTTFATRDRDADLTEGVVDPGGHAAALLRDDAQRDVGDDGVQQPDTDPGYDEPGQQRDPDQGQGDLQPGEMPLVLGRWGFRLVGSRSGGPGAR